MNQSVHLSSTAEGTRPVRILVADDHAMISECISDYLAPRINGMVSTRASFDDALNDALHDPCDIVLLDLVMPGMNGVSSVAKMAAALPNTHVVLFSSCTDHSVIIKAIKSGAHGFIPKDLPLSALIPAINLVLSGEVFIPKSFFTSFAFEKLTTAAPVCSLSPQQVSMLEMVGKGASNKEIGEVIGQSENNVKMLMRRTFLKLGANNRTHAVHIAQTNGWI